jgi:myosin heavy subunit
MLAQGGCCTLEDVDDAEEFGHVCEALATLGLRYGGEDDSAGFCFVWLSVVASSCV